MGAAVTFVLGLASVITYFIQKLLNITSTGYLQTIAFILVIASIVQFVEMVIKKMSPSLYQALGVYLPLITTNCAVLGIAWFYISNSIIRWNKRKTGISRYTRIIPRFPNNINSSSFNVYSFLRIYRINKIIK